MLPDVLYERVAKVEAFIPHDIIVLRRRSQNEMHFVQRPFLHTLDAF